MAPRFRRFSLLSFLLFVSLICVSVSHYQLTRDNLALRQQVVDLKDDLGYINVEDPDKIYVRRLESTDGLTWRYRIHLPPDRQFSLNTTSLSGIMSPLSAEQFTMTLNAQKSTDDTWSLAYQMPNAGGAMRFSLATDLDNTPRLVARGDAEEFDPDEEIELLSLLDGEFRVWIRPVKPPEE